MTRARSMIASSKLIFPRLSLSSFFIPRSRFGSSPKKEKPSRPDPLPPRMEIWYPMHFSIPHFPSSGYIEEGAALAPVLPALLCAKDILCLLPFGKISRGMCLPPSFHIQTPPPPPPLPATTQQNPRAVGKTLHFLCFEPPKPCVGKSTAECWFPCTFCIHKEPFFFGKFFYYPHFISFRFGAKWVSTKKIKSVWETAVPWRVRSEGIYQNLGRDRVSQCPCSSVPFAPPGVALAYKPWLGGFVRTYIMDFLTVRDEGKDPFFSLYFFCCSFRSVLLLADGEREARSTQFSQFSPRNNLSALRFGGGKTRRKQPRIFADLYLSGFFGSGRDKSSALPLFPMIITCFYFLATIEMQKSSFAFFPLSRPYMLSCSVLHKFLRILFAPLLSRRPPSSQINMFVA